ncbi:MAG: glycerol-3-phosphate dehydrogenase/oxidase, partial [Myxococcales bacterium]|nr:glycerol-3-phosphate dehydrogenase/oxidase [Myxococcales bacterium]
LAERLVVALLEDRSILATLTRTTVLRSDSEGELRRIRGGRDFLFGLGSWMQLGRLPTAPGTIDPATDQWRLSAPLGVSMGSRFVYRAWGLDAYASMLFGTSQLAARSNPGGGHADYSFGLGTGLRFFRYLAPASAQSFYVGGGASFQLSRYRVLSGEPHGRAEGLWGGGMYLDAVLGAEFLRASAMRFFVEATLGAPTYRFQSENDNGRIDAFILSGTVQIGLLL